MSVRFFSLLFGSFYVLQKDGDMASSAALQYDNGGEKLARRRTRSRQTSREMRRLSDPVRGNGFNYRRGNRALTEEH